MKDMIYALRRFHGLIHQKRLDHQRKIKLKKYLKYPYGTNAYVLGSPVYSNLGDSAILLAQLEFLRSVGWDRKQIKELTFNEYYQDREVVRKAIRNNQPIFGLGGGNMGNQWPKEERFRYDMLEDFPENPMVIFPQTIFFLPNSKEAELSSVSYYNGRDNLIMVAREKKSLYIMQSMYPDTNIQFTPDIVLSTSMEYFGVVEQERKGVLMCVRSDEEKIVDDNIWVELEGKLDSIAICHRRIDMYSDCSVTKENRAECVRKKMQEFCKAELVITDRLHGMIFAAITGTPCVTFSNYNYKVKGTYDWISYLPYIRYAETAEEAMQVIPELLQMKDCKFDNGPLMPYFDKLAEIIKEKCQ